MKVEGKLHIVQTVLFVVITLFMIVTTANVWKIHRRINHIERSMQTK